MSKFYNISLPSVDNDKTISFTAGSLAITLRLYWDNEMQEQYDALVKKVRNNYLSEPLYNKESKEIIKVYDYIDYYSSLPDTITELEEYVQDSKNIVPFALLDSEVWVQAEALLLTRKATIEIEELAENIERYLRWHFTLTCGEETIEGLVEPEGLYRVADGSFNFRFFHATLDTIGQNDLSGTFLVVEVVGENA